MKKSNTPKILKKPLSEEELKKLQEDDGRISVNIAVSLDDLLTSGGINGLNDIADERIIDQDTVVASLSDIGYQVVGHKENEIIINVNAEIDLS